MTKNTPPSSSKTQASPQTTETIKLESLEDSLEKSYTDYALSVIISRALPDIRDGLKPVHRRILYAMNEGSYTYDKPYKKSARVVGDVMGKYHPHGDSAIYDAMVRLAQPFSMSFLMIDGQGNFGSIDGDPAAAMRYTESRLHKNSDYLLQDIEKNTIDFQKNYDESLYEPSVLPARFPHILVNGAEGIAVGVATKIPPHNLHEVIKATLALIKDPNISLKSLMKILPGPDFPTGGTILKPEGIESAYETGKGSLVLRSKYTIETNKKGKHSLVFTEIPYQVNKSLLAQKIGEIIKEKSIPGLSEIRDESDRDGIRLVLDLTSETTPQKALSQLFQKTDLQINYASNMYALNNMAPTLCTLKTILNAFIDFRRNTLRRRTVFLLRKTREKAHITLGLFMALSQIDKIIQTIKSSKDNTTALNALMALSFNKSSLKPLYSKLVPQSQETKAKTVNLTQEQAKAILELRLQRLTGLEQDTLRQTGETLAQDIENYLTLLKNKDALTELLCSDLKTILAETKCPRRSIIETKEDTLILKEDPQSQEKVVSSSPTFKTLNIFKDYTFTKTDYKKTSLTDAKITSYHLQSNESLLVFTNTGMAYKIDLSTLEDDSKNTKKRSLSLLLALSPQEKIISLLPVPNEKEHLKTLTVAFITTLGMIRINTLEDFFKILPSGKKAFPVSENGELLKVLPVESDDTLTLWTKNGMIIRFSLKDIRVSSGLTGAGIKGITLKNDDIVFGAEQTESSILNDEEYTAYCAGKSLPKETKTLLSNRSLCHIFHEENHKTLPIDMIKVTSRGGIGQNLLIKSKKAGSFLDIKIINHTRKTEKLFIDEKNISEKDLPPTTRDNTTGHPNEKSYSIKTEFYHAKDFLHPNIP